TLVNLQNACSNPRTIRECGILGGLSEELATIPEPPASDNHVPGTHGSGHHD
ncbi:MAG TPA: Cd(II)/Pb(II)-responsive transcriptional regulator, partial [Marinobacter hydrocarbonoclasticus]|nr:Cd(II)/Pb(II)-responsive transcriptional regulator [Marinobacter nauticus]